MRQHCRRTRSVNLKTSARSCPSLNTRIACQLPAGTFRLSRWRLWRRNATLAVRAWGSSVPLRRDCASHDRAGDGATHRSRRPRRRAQRRRRASRPRLDAHGRFPPAPSRCRSTASSPRTIWTRATAVKELPCSAIRAKARRPTHRDGSARGCSIAHVAVRRDPRDRTRAGEDRRPADAPRRLVAVRLGVACSSTRSTTGARRSSSASTPAGVKYDRYWFNDTNNDRGWDAVWDVGRRAQRPEGWRAEFRIPFSQLRFNAGSDGTFGFAVVRDGRARERDGDVAAARAQRERLRLVVRRSARRRRSRGTAEEARADAVRLAQVTTSPVAPAIRCEVARIPSATAGVDLKYQRRRRA